MRHPDIINTARLGRDDFRSSFGAAEAATEIGADDLPPKRQARDLPEGFAIALPLAILLVVGAWALGARLLPYLATFF